MPQGTLTISIDLELAWGNWDNISQYHMQHIAEHERFIINRLLEIFNRYEISVTWAFVAALLDEKSSENMPGNKSLWYAPDIIDQVTSARFPHDIGSHGGRHRYFDDMSEKQAIEDLQFVAHIHEKNGLALNSFVYPRNKVARTYLLVEQGIKVYRGEDIAWHQKLRSRQVYVGRLANLVDKMLPIAPQVVEPEYFDNICNLPGSMLFFGRKGVRQFVSSNIMLSKLEKGLHAAIRGNSVFHLWFHPSNFWHNTQQQFKIFERFIAHATAQSSLGRLKIKPMAEFTKDEH
jgi:hypothetical protein